MSKTRSRRLAACTHLTSVRAKFAKDSYKSIMDAISTVIIVDE